MQQTHSANNVQTDLLTFMRSNSGHILNMTPYEALQCKHIAEVKQLPYEKVFQEMKQHKNSIDHRLYGKSLYAKFGLPEGGETSVSRSYHG